MSQVDDYRDEIHERYPAETHVGQIVKSALDALAHALTRLAEHGEFFSLERPTAPPQVAEWPKMFRHADGRELVVHSSEQAEALSSGWAPNVHEPYVGPKPDEPSSPFSGTGAVILDIGPDGKPFVRGAEQPHSSEEAGV